MANKKINQLVLKTTIQSTDLFPLGDATTGQLYKKTIAELQAAIGGAVISVNGLVGTVVLDTDDIQELASPTNKYFTDARARAAISLTTSGNSGASTYSSSTGVLNVPTYTLAGLGGITAGFLSGGTGITYNSGTGVISYSGTVYTDSSIRALVSAGTGLSYNSTTGVFSYSGTVYTDSSVRALITGTAPITYNNTTGAISISQATSTTNGYLSSADWITFNSKQSALTLGNVTESVSNVLMFPDGGTNKTIGNLSIQVVQAGSTTNGYLSTTDWNTFNNKQNAITLTTTGTSGAATFSSGTLNIPQYQAVLTNPVTGTGTTNYVAKWTSSSTLNNSSIQDSGSAIGIGLTPNTWYTGNSSRAIEIGVLGNAVWSYGSGTNINTYVTNNAYYDSVGFKYGQSTGKASVYQQNDGAHIFSSTNTTGTANGTLTLTERFRISSTGTATFSNIVTATGYFYANSTAPASSGFIPQLGGTSKGYFATAGTTGDLLNEAATGDLIIRSNLGKVLIGTYISGAGDAYAAITVANNRNVGIGASTSPTYLLEVSTAGGSQRIRVGTLQNNNNSATFEAITTANNTTASAAFFRANAGGSATIGVTTYSKSGGDSGNFANLSNQANTVAIQITGGANILLGTETDNGERLYVNGSIRATGSITANSDARLKKNIERIENALEKVGQISGYTYNTIYDEDRHAGVIAQEIDLVLPEIVNKGNDGLMGVEYGNISALLIEAIKEQKVLIESLQAKVEALSK